MEIPCEKCSLDLGKGFFNFREFKCSINFEGDVELIGIISVS